MDKNAQERIMLYFKKLQEPKSAKEVSEECDLPMAIVNDSLRNLVKQNYVISVDAPNNRKYYINNGEGITYDELSELQTKTVELLVPVKAASDDLMDEIDSMRKEIKGIYANMISIMAVFVAIFSIVLTGANTLTQVLETTWTWQSIVSFLVVEAAVVIAVCVMLFGIKMFLGV